VRFVVDKWHWNRYLSVYFGFLLLVLLHQCSLLIFICMLLLPGQTGEAWKASQKQSAFENRGALDSKFLSPFFYFRELKESEDHYCTVYTKTYASDAMRLYGGCVRNFYHSTDVNYPFHVRAVASSGSEPLLCP
jgi:hypothetical protein